jgi:hypothetical protein
MAKLDRLGWAAAIRWSAFGLRVGIRVNRPEILERLPTVLPAVARPGTGEAVDVLYSFFAGDRADHPGLRPLHLLYLGASRLARERDLEMLFARLKQDIPLRIAEFSPQHVFVHAGVVGWKGKAILIPGRSHTGKTTLVAELIKAGAAYYSDEYAVLDARGLVHPFPKPLSIRSTYAEPATDCTALELGGTEGYRPLPVGLVLVTEYRKGASWNPCLQSPGLGILALLANCVPARRRPRSVFAVLRRSLATAQILSGVRGEVQEVVETLLRHTHVA